MTSTVNLTLTYYFETLLRDVNSPRLCYVKDGGGVNDLFCKPNSDLLLLGNLLSRDVNTLRRCYVNNEVDS